MAWTGMGWLASLCVAAAHGPVPDLAGVCAPARVPQLVGVREEIGLHPCKGPLVVERQAVRQGGGALWWCG